MPPVIPRHQGLQPGAALPNVRVGTDPGPLEVFGGGQAAAPAIDQRRLAQVADALWQKQSEKIDTALVLESENKAWELEKELFHNPENGAFTRRGKDAMPALDEAMTQYRAGIDKITNGLTSERQRGIFKERSQSRRIALEGQVEGYVAGEIRSYTDTQYQAALDKITEQSALVFDNPDQLATLQADKRKIIETYGQQFSIDGDELEKQIRAESSKSHSVVLSRMLAKGFDVTAKAYFTAHEKEMTAGDRAEVERTIFRATTDGKAMRGAKAVWDTMKPMDINQPIRLADMDEVLRKQFIEEPDVLKFAMQDLRTYVDAFNYQHQQLTASNSAEALGAFNNGLSRAEVIRMPQYLALRGDKQNELNSYMADRNKTLTDRGREAQARRGFAAYWKYSDPTSLSTMSENEVLALEPTLGQELVTALMNGKRSMSKGEVKAASIDVDHFKYILRQSDIDPDDEDAAADIGALKFHTENAIEREQTTKGRVLTRDEKSVIMTKIINDTVLIEKWGRDPSKIMATLTYDERGRAYVPIATLNKTESLFVEQGIQWMRENGMILPNATDEQARKSSYMHNIERAYVVRRNGGTDKEVEETLRGAR